MGLRRFVASRLALHKCPPNRCFLLTTIAFVCEDLPEVASYVLAS